MTADRIFRYKFIYFYAIIFLLGWIIYYGIHVFNIVFEGFRLDETLGLLIVPIYFLFFGIFSMAILSLVNIFRESKRCVVYFNVLTVLLALITILNYYINGYYGKKYFFIALIFFFGLLSFSAFLINYYSYKSSENEIEDIGKST